MQSQQDTIAAIEATGVRKAALVDSPVRLLTLSAMAGAFIALGGCLSVIAGAAAGKIGAGLAFPVGLFLVVMFGAELFTGNNAVLVPGAVNRSIGIGRMLANWALVWLGNFVGALAVAYFLIYLTEVGAAEPFRSAIVAIAETKVSLGADVIFWRGIGANWCVCMAVWIAASAKTLPGKTLSCWIPVAAFVILGYEHCIANQFFIPCGWLQGATVTLWSMLRNLLWATLGNIVGGGIFVGLLQTYLHGKGK